MLGGVTDIESKESDANSYIMGKHAAFSCVKDKMEQLHGEPAEKWAEKSWDYVVARIEFLERNNI